MRAGTLAEYTVHIHTTTNRHGRPYQEKTITAYTKAAVALDRRMTAEGIADDFTACDTETLNRFFRWYYAEHGLPKSLDGKGGYTGGTNTEQRNLSPFFTWLENEFDHPNPWHDKRFQKYAAPQQGKPKTLSEDFVKDVLTVTGGGSPRVRDFETVRDHALVRVLTEGLRAEELLCLRVEDLDLERGVLHVVPLKGHRGSKDARTIPLQPKTVVALQRYLRVRAAHKRARDAWLWLGTRGRARLTYSGLYRIVKRRTEQAGYDPKDVSPHSFCHTWADDFLTAGVSGEDVMAIRGWKSHAMSPFSVASPE